MENQAYISRVHLKGYKSIRDMEIDFKAGLNIIIGPNGSGKTNFVEFLDKAFHLQVSDSKAKTNSVIKFFRNNQLFNLNYSVKPNSRSKEAQDVKISISDSNEKIVFERDYLKIGNKEILNNKNDKIDIFSDIF